jgi:glycosyltransferase involved in cell wall biosynthesis
MIHALVSILIPAYNAAPWIGETIESALAQTWKFKEVIVVDDGSTDKTLQTVRRYGSRGVRILQQENRGANCARNLALRHARGDYLQWLDADDVLAPDKIEQQMLVAQSLGDRFAFLTCPWARFYYRTQSARFAPDALWRDLDPADWLIAKFTHNTWMNPATWLVSRELTQRAGSWDERLTRDQDGEYVARLVSRSARVHFVGAARSYYRQCNQRSVSRRTSQNSLASLLLATALSIEHLRSLEDSPRTREACLAYLSLLLYYIDDDQPQLLARVAALAEALGGRLSAPSRKRRHAVAERLVSRRWARRAHEAVAGGKAALARSWDRLLARVPQGPAR